MMPYAILLVDDVLLNRKILKVALSTLPDFSFLEAADGVNALEIIHNQQVDLIILDLIMPGTGGFDVLSQLKNSVFYRCIPVIVYSAVSDTASIKRAMEMGAYDYLIKPLKPQELRTILPEKVRDALTAIAAPDQPGMLEQQAAGPHASGQKMVDWGKAVVGHVNPQEIAAIKYLTSQKSELKQLLKRLIDMDKEELYCCLYDRLIRELGETSHACEQWWDEKYEKYHWANIVGDEIEIDYDTGQVFIKKALASDAGSEEK